MHEMDKSWGQVAYERAQELSIDAGDYRYTLGWSDLAPQQQDYWQEIITAVIEHFDFHG
jgi:basic membrane lipoprotein Med (substrate-binding protein (PBP1-ABC) superfamily)